MNNLTGDIDAIRVQMMQLGTSQIRHSRPPFQIVSRYSLVKKNGLTESCVSFLYVTVERNIHVIKPKKEVRTVDYTIAEKKDDTRTMS